MLKNLFLLICLFLTIHANSQTFNLVWSDEFNGSGAPDPAKWGYELGYVRNNELQYYTNSTNNVRQNEGNLEIILRKETVEGNNYGKPATFNYTSGSVTTMDKMDLVYGKIEGRFKMPSDKGLWSCFWTLGSNYYNQLWWPKSGEIDIFEHINTENIIHSTLHWQDDTGKYKNSGGTGIPSTYKVDVTQWHTYAIEWSPDSIKWLVDNKLYFWYNIKDGRNGTQAFHKPHYVLINLVIGGNWPGPPDASTKLPATMYCDYIRIYEYAPDNSQTGNQMINCGGGIAGKFAADKWYSNGGAYSMAYGGQQDIYQSNRSGDLTYTITGLKPDSTYNARLHFAENSLKNAGARLFNVKINDKQVLTNFDIFASAGNSANNPVVSTFASKADASGKIAIQLISVKNSAQINGIEIIEGFVVEIKKITLPGSATINKIGGTTTLISTIEPSNASNKILAWTSSNTKVATVTSGVVKAVSNGTAVITATTLDGSNLTATTSITVNSNELIFNGDFSQGTMNWGNLWFNSPSTTEGTTSTLNEVYLIDITKPATDGWHICTQQAPFTLIKGVEYKISFDAWAENPNGLDIYLAKNHDDYGNYFGEYGLSIGATKQTYTLTTTMTAETDANCRLVFGIGRFSGKVYMDNVSVVKVITTPETTETIVNGGFENGKTGWEKSWGNWSIVSDKHSGSSAAMVPLASWGNGLVQRFNVDPQSVYEFKFWAKTSSKGTDLPVFLSIKNSKGQNIGPDPNYTVKVSAKDWTEYAIKFQTIELMDSVDLWVGDGKTDTIYFDDFEVNKSVFIANGGFEDGKPGWERSFGTFNIVNDVHSGNAAAMVALSNWSNGLVQRFDVEELSPYELKFWAKIAPTSKKVDIKLGLKNSAGKNVGPDPNFNVPVESKDWKQYSYKFNTLASIDSIDFWLGDGTTDSLYIDDIELIPTAIFTNGSFESEKTGWERSSGSFDLVSPAQSGEFAAKLPLSNWANVMVQRFNVDPVTSYEMKLWAKVSGTKPVDINLSEKNSAGKNVGPDPNEKISITTNAWKEYKLKFSTLAEVDSIDFWIGGGITDTLYIDNISVAPLAFTSVSGIALDSTSLSLKTNGTYKLKVTIAPATATNKAVKWVSSDQLIATVDENGTVKGISKGVATITATTVDGSLKALCSVRVDYSTGIEDQSSALFKIYPNPVTNNLLTISCPGAESYSISITSMNGQSIYTSKINTGSVNINTSSLVRGSYLVRITSKSESFVRLVLVD